jgi:heme-degrading monooxygenase HmoA
MTLAAAWHDRGMTVVKINAITVPPDGGDELARRFAARAGAVDNQDGFEGFELLRPTDDRTTWLVVTRWRDEAAFQAWVTSPAFGHGHRQAAEAAAQAHAAASAHAHAASPDDHAASPHDHAASHGGPHGPHGPVAVSSELWSFEIAGGAPGVG